VEDFAPPCVTEAEALKMVAGIKAKCYVERCEELGLDTLEKRRRIQDIVESYRILCSKRNTGARKRKGSRSPNQIHGISFQEKKRIEKCAAVQKNAEEQVEIVRGGEKIGEKQHHEVQSTTRKI
jgi:hypothetical protein